jgi:hypothetical protein
MKPKTAKALWTVITVIGVLAMLIFTFLPALQ